MTPLPLPSGKILNLANIAWAEWSAWRSSQPNGDILDFHGLILHFVGGTILKLTGEDACIAALKLGIA